MQAPRRILVACRGAAAAPILRWARQASVETVVLVQERDADAAWAASADYTSFVPEVEPMPWPSAEAMVEAALDGGCEAVHPGWSELARAPEAAAATALTGLLWVGATRDQLELGRSRPRLRARARELGVPVVPASGLITEAAHVSAWLAHVGLPAVLRPVDPRLARRVLTSASDFHEDEVEALLAHGPLVVERLVSAARELEVGFVGSRRGHVVLGIRETSVRDESGRVFVEFPATGLTGEVVDDLTEATRLLADELGWRGLGAARFLLPPDGRPYLLQLKAGLQPWDAATEVVLGLDLVDTQVRLAADEPLLWAEPDLEQVGHALSLMIRAREDGLLGEVRWPAGVRVDSGLGLGDEVHEGELLGVLTVSAPTRQAAIVRTRAALREVSLLGPATNLGSLQALFDEEALWRGPVDRDRAATVLGRGGAAAGPGERSAR